MSNVSAGAAAAQQYQHQRVVNATRAIGTIAIVEPDEFQTILDRVEYVPLVVHATGGWFRTNYQYLTNYKGIFFFTKSADEILFKRSIELVRADKILRPM